MQIEVNIDGTIYTFDVEAALSSTSLSYVIGSEQFLPEFLKQSERILTITDILDTLISRKGEVFSQIEEVYYDGIYKLRDYSKLSVEAKLDIISELGFDYIADIMNLDNDSLTRLLTFFNLIYMLKGKDEGLRLCLTLIGLEHLYMPWYIEATYKGEVETQEDLPKTAEIGDVYRLANGNYLMYDGLVWRYTPRWEYYKTKRKSFTAELDIIGNLNDEQIVKLRNFLRSYMLPWITVNLQIMPDPIPTYVWGGPGVINKICDFNENNAIATVEWEPLIIETIHNYRTVAQVNNISIYSYMHGIV